MAEKEKHIINIQGQLVEVTPDVYHLYFSMERQERGQEEKKQRNGVVSYDALDTSEMLGIESIRDMETPDVEEQMISKEIYEKLHRAINALPRAERELIQAVYFNDQTEQEYAQKSKTSQQTVSYRLKRTLSKIKTIMNFMGSF